MMFLLLLAGQTALLHDAAAADVAEQATRLLLETIDQIMQLSLLAMLLRRYRSVSGHLVHATHRPTNGGEMLKTFNPPLFHHRYPLMAFHIHYIHLCCFED